jgi:hypothetical protein
MGNDSSRPQAGTSRRLLRALWLALGVAMMALVGAWAAVMISDLMQSGHPLRAALLGGLALLLLVMGLLVAGAQWRGPPPPRRRPVLPPDGGDQTGIWGVGGPSMREPGNTGNWPTRGVDRRYENRQD